MSNKAWLVIFIFLFFSCRRSRYLEDTQLFNNYLKTYIHTSIPEDTVYYVLISEYGCDGCVGKVVMRMRENEKTMFIVSEDTYKKHLKPKAVEADKYLIDSTGKIKRLQYHYHNVGIVQTANKEIYNIISMTYEGADSVLAKIK